MSTYNEIEKLHGEVTKADTDDVCLVADRADNAALLKAIAAVNGGITPTKANDVEIFPFSAAVKQKLISIYNKIEKHHGKEFANTIRDHHNGLLEIPDIEQILYHAGEDAEPVLPYLVSLLSTKDAAAPLPDGFVLVGGQIFKYHQEINNIYYGDQAFVKDAVLHVVDKSAGNALFEQYLFDNKNKTLVKIDPQSKDSFADDFNRCYGGNAALTVQKGNLILGDEVLITAEHSCIKALYLPELTTMGNDCLYNASALTQFEAPALTTMGDYCLYHARTLTRFEAPALTAMGYYCLYDASALTQFEAPALTTMGDYCLYNAPALTQFEAPALTTMGNYCLSDATALTRFEAPALRKGVPNHLKHLIRPLATLVRTSKNLLRFFKR